MGKMPELIHERLGFESEETFDEEDVDDDDASSCYADVR